MSEDNKPLIILVEDQFEYVLYLKHLIEQCGFRVEHAHDHVKLPAVLERHKDAVAIVSDIDTTRESRDGIRWAEEYLQLDASQRKPFIFVSIVPLYARDAKRLGVDFIHKPLVDDDGVDENGNFYSANIESIDFNISNGKLPFGTQLAAWLEQFKQVPGLPESNMTPGLNLRGMASRGVSPE